MVPAGGQGITLRYKLTLGITNHVVMPWMDWAIGSQCACSVLNDVLWDMKLVHCKICDIGLYRFLSMSRQRLSQCEPMRIVADTIVSRAEMLTSTTDTISSKCTRMTIFTCDRTSSQNKMLRSLETAILFAYWYVYTSLKGGGGQLVVTTAQTNVTAIKKL